MPRPSVDRCKREFLERIVSGFSIYASVREQCVYGYDTIRDGDYHPRRAAKIVGLAFLSMVSAWEDFLEGTFLRYLAGALTSTGYAPVLRIGPSKSISHSSQILLSPGDQYGKWNDYKWVSEKARTFFHMGQPYCAIPNSFTSILQDAQVLRNRVAHNSPVAKARFRKLVNRSFGNGKDGNMPFGMSPGWFLIHNNPKILFPRQWIESHDFVWPDLYECFSAMYLEIADIIVPDCDNGKKSIDLYGS